MNKNSIAAFLNADISYLLGLITGRGSIQANDDVRKIVIDFEYKTLESKAITKVFDQKLYIQTSLDSVVLRLQNIGINTKKIVSDKSLSIVLSWENRDISWQFIEFLINGTRFSFHDFAIPQPIFETTDENKREFLRGLADTTAFVRKSNGDQRGKHRVYIEISNRNWHLPPQICQITQSLGVPIQYIGYGHPNIRGGSGTSWAKEHQIKIYAEDFSSIGFYISHKNEALAELANYNEQNFQSRQKLCSGFDTRSKVKNSHPSESHEKLPDEINGKHFDSFREICNCLGCYLR
jgi:hypothetical protein